MIALKSYRFLRILLLVSGSVAQATDYTSFQIPEVYKLNTVKKEYEFLNPTYYHKIAFSVVLWRENNGTLMFVGIDEKIKNALIFALEQETDDRSTWREKILELKKSCGSREEICFRSSYSEERFSQQLYEAYRRIKEKIILHKDDNHIVTFTLKDN